MSDEIDLGHGHMLRFTCWSPDRTLNPQWKDVPDIERLGAIILHPNPKMPGGRCEGAIYLDTPEAARVIPDGRHRWQVHSWEPLTLSPSILCRARNPDGTECGDHGFIRDGKWVPA